MNECWMIVVKEVVQVFYLSICIKLPLSHKKVRYFMLLKIYLPVNKECNPLPAINFAQNSDCAKLFYLSIEHVALFLP